MLHFGQMLAQCRLFSVWATVFDPTLGGQYLWTLLRGSRHPTDWIPALDVTAVTVDISFMLVIYIGLYITTNNCGPPSFLPPLVSLLFVPFPFFSPCPNFAPLPSIFSDIFFRLPTVLLHFWVRMRPVGFTKIRLIINYWNGPNLEHLGSISDKSRMRNAMPKISFCPVSAIASKIVLYTVVLVTQKKFV